MHTFLLSDTSNEGEDGVIVVEFSHAKVFLLEKFFGLEVCAWCFAFQEGDSLGFAHAVWK
jgi:hypothetical protein